MPPEGFTAVELRAAALRVVGLAARFERRSPGSRDTTAERQVRRLLRIVNAHIHEVRRVGDRALVGQLAHRMADLYRSYKVNADFDGNELTKTAKFYLESAGYEATEDALDELVPDLDEIDEDRGPQEAADIRVAAVVGLDPKSVRNARLKLVPVDPETPFGVRVGPLTMMLDFVEMLRAAHPAGPTTELAAVKQVLLKLIDERHQTISPALARLKVLNGKAPAKSEM